MMNVYRTVTVLFLTFWLGIGKAQAEPVQTAQGAVTGIPARLEGVTAWLGLPYAQPPVGERRWRQPEPPRGWEGVRAADSFAFRCMQTNPYPDMIWNSPGESEDCLYLNLWAPEGAKDLPVMVWIHGGGYLSGSGDEVRHDGAALAARGVVVVTFNYRLGAFGFLAHPWLSAETENGTSGNYGYLDMLAVLRWVQANIAGFGGDPGNVTIFGESAGSMGVSTLMASPLAAGLFHKVIGQSGAAFEHGGKPVLTLSAAEALGQQIFAGLGVTDLPAARALEAERFVTAWPPENDVYHLVEGWVLPDAPVHIFAAGRQNDVPLIAGFTTAESKWANPTRAEFESKRAAAFPRDPQRAAVLYPASSDADVRAAAIALASDTWIVAGTWKWIEMQAGTGEAAVYRYVFDQVMATPQGPVPEDDPGAQHATDIPFVFDRLDYTGNPVSVGDRVTAELMGAYWTNFARTGNPNGDGLPAWPEYRSGGRIMRLSGNPEVIAEPHRDRYEFIDAQRD